MLQFISCCGADVLAQRAATTIPVVLHMNAFGATTLGMFLGHLLSFSKIVLGETIQPGDAAIDATVGNGLDTLFLSRSVGETGQVFGFDVQPLALEKTRRRLTEEHAPAKVTLFQNGHEHMAGSIPAHLHGTIAAVMFNLGYLPGSDEHIITRPETTLVALDAALSLLRPLGVVSLVAYTAHPGGHEEADRLDAHIRNYDTSYVRALNISTINDPTMQKHVVLLQRCK